MRELRTCITKMKSIGEMGSPCRSPLSCAIRRPGLPLMRALVLAVDNKIVIQLVHQREKPMC